jgi:hypothetical protein
MNPGLFQRLITYAGKNKDVLQNVGIGSAINAVFGALAEGPSGALKYGVGDFLFSYPATLGARKLAGGAKTRIVLDPKTGQKLTENVPRGLENLANIGASVTAPFLVDVATSGMRPQVIPTEMSQEQQIMQQLVQRQALNGEQPMALFPGTMSQAQGAETTLFRDFLAQNQLPSLEVTAGKRRGFSVQPMDYMDYATNLRKIQ